MEVYILDSLLRRTAVVDLFESLIWTERWTSIGDFELLINSTAESRGQFVNGVLLSINNSNRVMVVETVENSNNTDGKNMLKVKGRSLESILEHRVAAASLSDLTTEPKWVLSGKPADIARAMFDHICVTGALDLNDKIPLIAPGNLYPADNIPEPAATITWEQEPDTLYKAIKDLCELYDLGFRLTRDDVTSKLYFNVYSGNNRTTLQSALPSVVFAPGLENLQNTTELTTMEQAKNVAYVFSPQGFEMVYPDNFDPDTNGYERRVLVVKVGALSGTDPDFPNDPPTEAEVSAYLIQKGKEELSKTRAWSAFDGELNRNSSYKYGVDYYLGDLITMQNADGAMNNMRVTEQIFVHDQEGERSYPTLAINQFIAPGSWISWKYNKFWIDFGTTEFWSTQA